MEPTGKTYVGSDELYADVQRTMRLCAEMNSGYHTEVPPRVEYSLTDRAQSLMPLLHQLMDWAYHNLHDIVTDREKYYGQN